MNRYVTLVPVAILILGGTGIVSQAFAATVMTLNTDNHVYDPASTIILSGNVDPVDPNGSDIAIICKSPGGAGVCGIYQLDVNSDGSWSGQIVLNPEDRLQSEDGVYEIRAQYGSTKITTSIELTNAVETSEGTEVGTAVTGTSSTSVP